MNPNYMTTRPQSCGCDTCDSCDCCDCCVSGNQCCQDCRPPRPCPPPPLRAEEADINCGCGCSCAAGLVGALQLLCDPRFASLIDFAGFTFVTDQFVLGSSLNCPAAETTAYDNLTGPLDAEFVRINTNSCDRLEVSGQIYYPIPVCAEPPVPVDPSRCCPFGPGFTASKISLCSIVAVAFTVVPFPTPNGLAEAYQQAKLQFWQALHPGRPPMPSMPARPTPCDSTEDSISGRRAVSLTAGPLLVANAAVLGSVGDVLVLANDEDSRFYFVCSSTVDLLG